MGYLNINSLRNKITQLREVCRKVPIDLLFTDKTKSLKVISTLLFVETVTKMVGENDFY